MDVELLHVPDCPNRDIARDRLTEAIARAGIHDAVVRERVIASAEEADRSGMRGSPTILLDGRDPFASDADVPSLACRLYRDGGAGTGSPSVEQLVAALSA